MNQSCSTWNPQMFRQVILYAFFSLQFQFSSWKNFLSSLLSRSMPIVKRLGKSESFFSFVPTMSFWTGQQQSWHWHQVLEWTIIQLFSIQFYSRMMTAVVCISYRKISSKHFSSKMDNSTFSTLCPNCLLTNFLISISPTFTGLIFE